MYKTRKFINTGDNEQFIKYVLTSFSKQAISAFGGFLASSASFSGLAPFGISLSAAIFPEYIPACILGCAAGYFYIYGATLLTLRYLAAAAVGGIISYLFKRNFQRIYHRWFSAASGFFSALATGLIISLSVTLSADEIMLYSAEAAASGLGAWFFDSFLNIDPSKKFAARLNGIETASILAVFGTALLALNSFSLLNISTAVIFGTYAVLVCSTYGGDKYGALSGILAGLVLGFSGNGNFITGGISLGGLLSGIFGKGSRFISSVIFILSVAITAFATDDWIAASYIIYGVGIACILFILTPKKIKNVFMNAFTLSADGVFLSGQRSALKMRLYTASDGMGEVASAVKAIGGIYRRRIIPDEEKIYDAVRKNICQNCKNYDFCYNKNHNKIRAALENTLENMKLGEEYVEGVALDFCSNPQAIIKNLSLNLEKYRNALREVSKTGETVNIVSDQFASVSDFLAEMSDTVDSTEEYEPNLSELVTEVLKNEFGINTISCGVFKTRDRHIYCELSFAPGTKLRASDIKDKISEAMDIQFEKPVVQKLTDGTKRLTMCQKTKYKILYGTHQISIDGGEWCGDTFNSFFDGKGKYYMVLSDGMGTGKKAAADSVMCSSLACGMLRSGFPVNAILKMINAAMLVRSGEESLATLDIAEINLYNGNITFFKAGAVFSIVMKHNKMLKIEKNSLPVGILQKIEFEKVELQLHDGDAIVMMTDGVTREAVSMWRDILKSATSYDGNELADILAKTAHLNMPKEAADDITVLTATLVTNE